MLRKILYFSFLLGLLNVSAQAAEGTTIYGGIQGAQVTYEDDFVKAEPGALVLRLGGYLDKEERLGIEVRAGLGLAEFSDREIVDVDVLGVLVPVPVDYNVDALLGLYGVYHMGWGTDASLYGVLGITQAGLSASGVGVSDDFSNTRLSYGIGFNVVGLNLEYMHYLHDRDYDVTAISVGYVASF